MNRILFAGLMTIAAASAAGAQFSNFPRSNEPAYWMSFGVGAMNGQGVQDGATTSAWDFGQQTSWQYRATLEKAIQNESSFGILATYANVPFTYRSGATTGTNTCSTCAAHLNMFGLHGQFHAGGGLGFHQVIQVAAGVTAYRNLRQDTGGGALAPVGGAVDPSFVLGYGFGYGFSPNAELTLIQDYGLILHENTGLPSGTSNTNTIRSTRFGIRYGFGSRSAIRRR